jgi:hypothetical protein
MGFSGKTTKNLEQSYHKKFAIIKIRKKQNLINQN